MRDQFDVDLEDGDLLSEVELSISLMIAGTESVERLSRDEIDAILGVTPVPPSNALLRSEPAAWVGRRSTQTGATEGIGA
jgi:hypothetical protein